MSAARGRGLGDLPVRVGTAVIFGVLLLGALLFGRALGWGLLVGAAAGVAVSEVYTLTRERSRLPNELLGVVATAALPVSTAIWGIDGLVAALTVFVVAALLWHLAFRQVLIADTAVTVFGVVYVGFTLAHLVLMRLLDSGTLLVLTTLVSVWVGDSVAYFVGKSLGRHKMSPRVSPKKTWEGLAAGTVATIAVWAGAQPVIEAGLTMTTHLVAGAAVAAAAVCGDLVESRLKRETGVKDSGRSLPGHGGFLDRFDSLILVSVVVYHVLVWGGAS